MGGLVAIDFCECLGYVLIVLLPLCFSICCDGCLFLWFGFKFLYLC